MTDVNTFKVSICINTKEYSVRAHQHSRVVKASKVLLSMPLFGVMNLSDIIGIQQRKGHNPLSPSGSRTVKDIVEGWSILSFSIDLNDLGADKTSQNALNPSKH